MASPEKSRPITVTVTAIYGGQKAEQWRTVNIGTVQRDLDYLDFVQPKRQNFSFGERGVVQFWWDTTFHSILHKTLLSRVRGEIFPGLSLRRCLSKVSSFELDKCSLRSMSLSERTTVAQESSHRRASRSASPTPASTRYKPSRHSLDSNCSRHTMDSARTESFESTAFRRSSASRSFRRSPSPPVSDRVGPSFDQKEISQSLQELSDIRQQIRELAERKDDLRHSLGETVEPDDVHPDDFLTRIQLRMLRMEKEKERTRALKSVAALRSIRDEGRSPFVYVKLFRTFVLLSKLTTDAVEAC